jgi:iron(III) transport system substrate-binding protein
MRLRVLVAVLVVALGAICPVGAFTPDRPDNEAARKEGTLSWYTSTPFPLVQHLADRFQQDTGIKVQILRTGGQAVLRRLQHEIAAGRLGADVMTMSDAAAANGLAKQGLFEPFKPEGFDQVLDDAKDAGGRWIAQRISLIGIPIRTDRITEKDAPKTWSDLVQGRYKGLMVMPDPSFTAIQLIVVGTLSRKFGWDFYKALRANDTMIVQGHQQVFSVMQQGERVIGAEGADPRSFADGKDVPNQKMIYPTEGVFIVSSPTAVLKGARNPNAAKLFAEFMLSPVAQKIIAQGGIHSSRRDIAQPAGQPALSAVKFIRADLDHVEDHARGIKAKFSEIFQ